MCLKTRASLLASTSLSVTFLLAARLKHRPEWSWTKLKPTWNSPNLGIWIGKSQLPSLLTRKQKKKIIYPRSLFQSLICWEGFTHILRPIVRGLTHVRWPRRYQPKWLQQHVRILLHTNLQHPFPFFSRPNCTIMQGGIGTWRLTNFIIGQLVQCIHSSGPYSIKKGNLSRRQLFATIRL